MEGCGGIWSDTFCSITKTHGVPADVACAIARLAHVLGPSDPLHAANGAIEMLQSQGHNLTERRCPVTGGDVCTCANEVCGLELPGQ